MPQPDASAAVPMRPDPALRSVRRSSPRRRSGQRRLIPSVWRRESVFAQNPPGTVYVDNAAPVSEVVVLAMSLGSVPSGAGSPRSEVRAPGRVMAERAGVGDALSETRCEQLSECCVNSPACTRRRLVTALIRYATCLSADSAARRGGASASV